MPAMPARDNFDVVPAFLRTIENIRSGKGIRGIDNDLEQYWRDLALLLVAYHHSEDTKVIDEVQSAVSQNFYFPFLERRKTVKRPEVP